MSEEIERSGSWTADVQEIIKTFSGLADTLVQRFDLAEVLGRVVRETVRLVPAGGAAILLNRDGVVHLAAASDGTVRELGELEVASGSGPCRAAARRGEPMSVSDLSVLEELWPRYGPAFVAAGYHAVHTRPMRDQKVTIGSLGAFSRSATPLSDCAAQLTQALADIAALAVVQDGRDASAELVAQLQHALDSRVVVEQAKGVIAAHAGVDMATAFAALRLYARSRGARLSAVARAVTDRQIPPHEILETD